MNIYPSFARLFLTSALLVGAHTASAQEASPEATSSDVEINIIVDQEIADEELLVDIEAETLPDESFRFGVENALYRIRRAFTFQAERKVQLDQNRLQHLDRKLTLCADIGDQECVERINAMIAAAEERTEKFIERKEEVLGNIEEHFEEWRTRRQEHIQEKRLQAAARKEQREELLEELQAKRLEVRSKIESERQERKVKRDERLEEIRQRREEHKELIDELQGERQEAMQERIEERQQNREELIELRSERLKTQLDATRQKAQEHREALQEQQAKTLEESAN